MARPRGLETETAARVAAHVPIVRTPPTPAQMWDAARGRGDTDRAIREGEYDGSLVELLAMARGHGPESVAAAIEARLSALSAPVPPPPPTELPTAQELTASRPPYRPKPKG